MIVRLGSKKLIRIQAFSAAEILLLLYISSIIIISMVPSGNIVSKGFGLLMLFYFLIFQVIWEKKKIYLSRENNYIGIWLFFCLLSTLFALDIHLVAVKFATLIQLVLLFIAGYSMILQDDRIRIEHIFYTIIFSVVITYAYGVSTQGTMSGMVYQNRLASTAGDPNILAVFGAFAFLFSLYLFLIQKRWQIRVFLSGIVVFLIYGIIKTQSRQGILLIIISSVLYLILNNLHKLKHLVNRRKFIIRIFMILAIVLIAIVIAFYFFRKSEYYARFNALVTFLKLTMKSSNSYLAKVIDHSAYERRQLARYGVLIWLDHPLFGIGLDNFRVMIKHYWPISRPLYSHNNYIELLSSIGTFGAIAYYLIYASIFTKLITLRKKLELHSKELILVHIFITAMLSLMAVEFVTVSYYTKFAWILFLIILAFSKRISHQLSDQKQDLAIEAE